MSNYKNLRKVAILSFFVFMSLFSHNLRALTLDDALDPGGVITASISPDGKLVAGIAFTGLNRGIFLIDIATKKSKIIHSGSWVTKGYIRYKREARRIFG